eukprot:6211029-Pleurochrysis_carterae.AAC.1
MDLSHCPHRSLQHGGIRSGRAFLTKFVEFYRAASISKWDDHLLQREYFACNQVSAILVRKNSAGINPATQHTHFAEQWTDEVAVGTPAQRLLGLRPALAAAPIMSTKSAPVERGANDARTRSAGCKFR